MMANMVDEGGITNQSNRGVRDHRLTDKAHLIADDQEVLKQDILTANQRRKTLYSKEVLLPQELLNEVPYRNTYEALKEDN